MSVKFDANAFVNRTYKGLARGRDVMVDTANTVGKVQAWALGVGSASVAALGAILALRALWVNFSRRDDPRRPSLGTAGMFALGAVVLGLCAAYQIWEARSNSAYAKYQRRVSGAMTTASVAGDVWGAFWD